MANPLPQAHLPAPPDISHLVMEDNGPVAGTYSERQMRLLVDALYDGWDTRRKFMAQANVGVFYSIHQPAVVPDVFVSLDVEQRQDAFDRGRSYLLWEYGKPPDVAVEVVSNSEGEEEQKLLRYASFGIPFVVIFDPEGHLSNRPLRVWEHHGREYVECAHTGWLAQVGLGLTIWEGTYQGLHQKWLRWCDQQGAVLPLGSERAAQEHARADEERARADRLAARLRDLGIDEA